MSDITKQIATLRKCIDAIKAAHLDPNESTAAPAYVRAIRKLQNSFSHLPYTAQEKLPIIGAIARHGEQYPVACPFPQHAALWSKQIQAGHKKATDELAALPNRRRHRMPAKEPLPLTTRQLEAFELVSKHKGNRASAAREAGISAARMGELYATALAKLAQAGIKKPKMQALPKDSRGQATVADPSGPRARTGRVNRKPPKDQDDD